MSLIKCSECKKKYSDNATVCPNCGNPTSVTLEIEKIRTNSNAGPRIQFSIILVGVGLLFFAIGAFVVNNYIENNNIKNNSNDNSSTNSTANGYYDKYVKEAKKAVKVLEQSGETNYLGFVTIKGIAINNSSNEVKNVVIKYKVSDQNQVLLGTCSDRIDSISSGEKWKFEMVCSVPAKDAKNYKLDEITYQ